MSETNTGLTNDPDFDELLNKCLNVLKTKGVDYAKVGDRLAGIRATANKYKISMRQVLGVYIDKHHSSINKWLSGDELKGEPIDEKLLDNIVYSLLIYKVVKEEIQEKKEEKYELKEWFNRPG